MAVIALGVDRLILGGEGGPAAAAAAQQPLTDEPAAPVPARASTATQGMGVPVAKQLASLPAANLELDGFSAPVRWREALARVEAAAAAAAPARGAVAESATDPLVARFMKHQLTAVLSEKGLPAKALVKVAPSETRRGGSRLLKIGDELDGFKLIHLENEHGTTAATFADASGQVVELQIPVAGQDGKSE